MLKSFRKKRKKLIAIGCSYTADWNPFPPWPQHLAEMLDMKCVNLARSGSGNEEISAKVLDAVLKEKNVGLIVLMWSEWQRMDFQLWTRSWDNWWHLHPMPGRMDNDISDFDNPDHNTASNIMELPKFRRTANEWAVNLLGANNPHHITQKTLRTFIHTQKLVGDIPYLFIQGPPPIPFYNVKISDHIDCSVLKSDLPECLRENTVVRHDDPKTIDFYKTNDSRHQASSELSLSPYLNYIDDNISKNFIGWPVFSELDGYDVDDILNKIDPEQEELRISKEDTHPNGEGHKIIAQEIYNAYAKIYT